MSIKVHGGRKMGLDDFYKKNIPRKWSELSYAGEKRVPPGEEPASGYWPTIYLKRTERGQFLDHKGEPIAFKIRYPDSFIDFENEQLEIVKKTLQNITEEQIMIAKYWGFGGKPTKQWTPIIDRLIDTYDILAPRAGRILAAVQGGLNDAFVVTWFFKFLWKIPRTNQLDKRLTTIICTPEHPSYPSGHASIAGCAQIILSYYFPTEADRLKELAEECAVSRLYGGVHYPIDNDEGLRLGRHIGELVVAALKEQRDNTQSQIDFNINEDRNAVLPPPPYKQVIPFPDNQNCGSKVFSNNTQVEEISNFMKEIREKN